MPIPHNPNLTALLSSVRMDIGNGDDEEFSREDAVVAKLSGNPDMTSNFRPGGTREIWSLSLFRMQSR